METQTQTLNQFIHQLTAPEPVPLNAADGIQRLPRDTGIVFETNEETYDYFLDALPVQFMTGHLFCFAEGFTPHTLFFRRHGRFFVRQLTQAETARLCRLAGIPLPGHW